MECDVPASPHPHTNKQAIEPVEPSHPLAIHEPAFTTQEHPDPQRPKPRAGMSQISNAQPERRLILGPTASTPRGPTKLRQATGPQATDLKRPVKPGGQFATAGGS